MSDEPLRLLDDPGTPDLLREDLEKERNAPWEYDAALGLAALRAAIQSGGPLPDGDGPGGGTGPPGGAPQAGPPPASPPAAPPPAVAAAAAKGGVAAKGLLLGLAAVGVAAGLTVAVGRWSSGPSTPESAPVLPPASATAAAGVADTASSADLTAGAPTLDSAVAPPTPNPLSVQGEGAAARVRAVASAARDQRNAEEIAHMITLREKASTNPAEALALADVGQQKFAGGLFSLEREFLAIQSLARLGRAAEARRRGAQFIAAHPSSPYADRVRAVIGESPP